MVLSHKYFNGKVPVSAFTPSQEVEAAASHIFEQMPEQMHHWQFRQALFDGMNLARAGNKFLADAQPWKLNLETEREKVADIIAYSIDIVARLSVALAPFLPDTSARIRKMLNLPETFVWNDLLVSHLQEGHALGLPEILFRKIEDSEMDAQLAKLEASKASRPIQTPQHKPVKDAISYDDFMKMDIRVATVLEAERVPKADKLLKLLLDTGVDKRIVVSGIAEHFTPEEIVGRQVSILMNLEPRKIRGIESQGMILMAADESGKLEFVQPGEKVSEGAEIR